MTNVRSKTMRNTNREIYVLTPKKKKMMTPDESCVMFNITLSTSCSSPRRKLWGVFHEAFTKSRRTPLRSCIRDPEANIDRYFEKVLIDNDAGLSVKGSKEVEDKKKTDVCITCDAVFFRSYARSIAVPS